MRQYFKNLKISVKLHFGAMFTFSILLLVIVFITSWNVQNLITRIGRRQVEQDAEMIQRRFAEVEQSLLINVKFLVDRPSLVEAITSGNADEVKAATLTGGASFDIIVVDHNGDPLGGVDEVASAQKNDLLSSALRGIESTGVVLEWEQDQVKLCLAAAVPLYDTSGRVVGGVIAGREVDDAFLQEINLSRRNIDLALVYEGQVLSLVQQEEHQGALEEREASLLDQDALRQALEGQTVVAGGFIRLNGIPHVMVHAPLMVRDQTQAVIVVLANVEALVGFQKRLTVNMIYTFAFLIVVAAGWMIVFARHNITTPLQKLQEVAWQMAGGDYSQSAEVRSEDEIGQLGRALNEMGDAVQRRKRALQQQRDFLQQVVDINPFFIFAKDREGRYTLANQAFAEAFGATVEELLGKTDGDFDLSPELLEQYRRSDQAVFDSGRERVIPEERIVKGDNLVVWRHSIKRPIVDEDGVVRHLLGVAIDITDRKAAQEERVHFISQLRTAADVAEQISTILDPDLLLHKLVTLLQTRFGLYHVHIYLLDRAKRELIARAGSGTVGQLMQESGYKIALDHPQSIVARAARDRAIVLVNDVSAEPDFLPHPLLPYTRAEVATPLIASDRLMGVFDVQDNHANRFSRSDLDVFNILSGQIAIALENADLFVERQRAEEALALAHEQALAASQLKGQLLANVSHDLRTPLGVIMGYAEMLQGGIYGTLSEQQCGITQRIIRNTKRLTGMVSKLMAQAQIESGALKLEIDPFASHELIEQMQSTMQVLAEDKGLQLVSNISDDVPSTLHGDVGWLHQILANLVENALKFTEQGSIEVRIYRPDEDRWAIQVSDTGPGIPAEAHAYIFDAFRQVDGSITRKHGGSGLGLSIVNQLTTMMGGQILLESEVGQGTTFTILLPLTPIQEAVS
jgi:PAS domain S-box-containing protein